MKVFHVILFLGLGAVLGAVPTVLIGFTAVFWPALWPYVSAPIIVFIGLGGIVGLWTVDK